MLDSILETTLLTLLALASVFCFALLVAISYGIGGPITATLVALAGLPVVWMAVTGNREKA